MALLRSHLLRRIALAAALALALAAVAVALLKGEATTAMLAGFAVLAGALSSAPRRRFQPLATLPVSRDEEDTTPLLPADAVPDPAIVVDPRSVVLSANAAARAALPGLRNGQPLALALRDPAALEAVPQVAASGRPRSVEVGGRIPGEPVWEVRLRPLATDPEAPRTGRPSVVLFLRDLSAERSFGRMQVDFVANVSHELRTPLASLSGFIDTLQGPARDDATARGRFLGIMAQQAARMRRLIDDLLQLSRVELNEHVAPTGIVDLGLAVGHMLSTMAPLAQARGASVAFGQPAEPIEVRGDRDEILRLVENLVENAIKYGGEAARVEVELRQVAKPGGRAWGELTVRDHGPGIAPEHLPRLTERFYRIDVGRSRQEGGTGLGLAIVKHIVSRHRGRLSIESEPGQGATFRVRLPTPAAA